MASCVNFSGLILVLFTTIVASKVQNNTGGSLRFMVLGDWGGLPEFPYRTPIESAIAGAMGRVAKDLDAQFIMALGDNFYFDGVKDVHDPRFKETYEDIFTAASLQKPWLMTAGNHDHNGNVSAQIAYAATSMTWFYPNYYYPYSALTPDGASVDIFMIDTVIFAGNSDADFLGKTPKGPDSVRLAEDQWTWLEEQMRNSKADYMLVAGHYPVYSIAEHGPTAKLVKRLDPLLHKYSATAYLCGHEHNIQHLQFTSQNSYNQTMDYFVSGASNFIDTSLKHSDTCVPPCRAKFHWANKMSLGSFSYIDVNKDRMLYTFMGANGKSLYQHSMKPRKVQRN